MAAIINKDFRLRSAKTFTSDLIDNANAYYLFFGQPDTWSNSDNPPNPLNTDEEIRNARNKMMALQTITEADILYGVPRVDWISGTTYSPYTNDQELTGSSNYYIMTDELNVYICIQQGKDSSGNSVPSTVKPTLTTANSHATELADGYIWKFLFPVTATESLKFLSAGFIPIKRIESEPDPGSVLIPQWSVQQGAIDGAIHSIDIVSSGSGINSVSSASISGDGTGFSISPSDFVISGGQIVDVKVNPSNIGSGYTNAKITVTVNGSEAPVIKPVFSPAGGFGFDPREELRAHYVIIHTLLDQAGDNDKLPVDNDYRQIGLIRNPTNFGTTNVSSGTSLNAMKTLQVDGPITATKDDVIEGYDTQTPGLTGTKAIFVSQYIDESNNYFLKYIQDDRTGYGTFNVGEEVYKVGSINSTTGELDIDGSPTVLSLEITALVNPDINKDSGEIIFLENRSKIDRTSAQTERVKLVLEF